ncbi:MAG: putative bifunctional diguanylate cyclase/phosphodiesterase [Selenomonadaceae bacterium]
MKNAVKKSVMLIVDDVEINRVILAQFFKGEYEIVEAENGEEALKILNERKVDIVMLDIVMPVMDGFEVLSRMKHDERFSDIPVIATTARSEGDSEVRAMEMGAADFITKPYNPTVVRIRVRNVMARLENEWRKVEQAAQSQQIVEMRRTIERDSLTGIYDRENFYRRASQLMQSNTDVQYAIVYFDISSFKVVNDLFHIETGNLVLRTAAAYFKHVVEGIGVAGRLEADHFALCLPIDTLNMDDLIIALDSAIQSLSIQHNILFYAGVYPVSNAFLLVDQMIDRAHMALNTVKGKYQHRYAFYDEKMRDMILEEQMILREMEYALDEGQFSINVQPIYGIKEKCDTGAEALIRWYHPEHGLISPARFVPLFERNGFIVKLDHFVWEECCKLLAEEKKKFGKVVPLSVNFSRLDFYDDSLLDYFKELLKRYNLEPSTLKIELTEVSYTDNPMQIVEATERFREAGFKVIMDDFGSGYSSLSMLRNLPVDILKIDMRFVQDVATSFRAAAIMKNIVQLAKDLDMGVIIEGVETKEQIEFLEEIGCDQIQGYYFSKPLITEDYLDRLERATK